MFGRRETFDPYQSYRGMGDLEETAEQLETGGMIERFFTYVFQVVLTASQVLLNQRITVNGDAPFVIKQLTREKTGDFRIRLFDNEGRYYSSSGEGGTNDRVRDDCLFGDGSLPFLMVPHIWIPPSGSIGFDLEDVSGNNNTVHIALHGAKVYRK